MRAVTLLSLAAALLLAAPALAIINPHVIDYCPSCHLKDPSMGPDDEMDYNFLAEEIDRTCHICHEQDCCTIGEKHHTHPSGIDDWDKEKFTEPENLPLQDGYITCVTCHYWVKRNNPDPENDYKLVRMVEVKDTKIDWTVLCHDCHKDY